MKKVLTVVGARPQFIKASVVSNAFDDHADFEELILHTGQHYDPNMSDVFFKQLKIKPPTFQLDINGGTHGQMTGRMLIEIEEVILANKPDILLVYGDTNSTLAGALAAAKLHVPIAHVEAGLRSFNMKMPEEINRILTDNISQWLFTPTELAMKNLADEGTDMSKCILVGDVMLDASLHFGQMIESFKTLDDIGVEPGNFILATIHRQENTDHPQRLKNIIDAMNKVAANLPVVWPIHPRTRGILAKTGALETLSAGVKLIEPIDFLAMLTLEKSCALVLTDSGGIQKEAFFQQKPCVTVRDETEWMELVDAGWNRLVPPDNAAAIVSAVEASVGTRGADIAPYGDGRAAQTIVSALAG